MVKVDQVPALQDHLVDGLLVERGALGLVAHLPCLVQQPVDGLVACPGRVQAAAAGVELVDVPIRIHPAAPADDEGPKVAVVVVLEGRGELRGSEADIEAGLLGHALDDLAHSPLLGIVDDGQLEAVPPGQPSVGQELLGLGDIPGRALAALVVKRAHGGDRRAARRVLAVPGHLVQRFAVDTEIERLADPWIIGEGRPQIDRRCVLPVLVVEVDGDAQIVEAGDAGHLEPALLLQAGGIGRRDQVHHVDVARAQVGQPHVVVGDDPEHDPLELGLVRVEVVLGLLQDDPILGHALDERPGAHADGGGAKLIAQFLGLGRRDRHARPIGQGGQDRGEGRLQAQAHRQGVDDLDGGDQLQLAAPTRALQVEVAVEGEPDRLGVHQGTVVELHPRAQLDRHGLAPVGEGRQGRRELREDLEILVNLVQLLAHVLVNDAPHVGPRQRGIQNVRVLVERHHECLLWTLRVGDACQKRQDGEQPHGDPYTLHQLPTHDSLLAANRLGIDALTPGLVRAPICEGSLAQEGKRCQVKTAATRPSYNRCIAASPPVGKSLDRVETRM